MPSGKDIALFGGLGLVALLALNSGGGGGRFLPGGGGISRAAREALGLDGATEDASGGDSDTVALDEDISPETQAVSGPTAVNATTGESTRQRSPVASIATQSFDEVDLSPFFRDQGEPPIEAGLGNVVSATVNKTRTTHPARRFASEENVDVAKSVKTQLDAIGRSTPAGSPGQPGRKVRAMGRQFTSFDEVEKAVLGSGRDDDDEVQAATNRENVSEALDRGTPSPGRTSRNMGQLASNRRERSRRESVGIGPSRAREDDDDEVEAATKAESRSASLERSLSLGADFE